MTNPAAELLPLLLLCLLISLTLVRSKPYASSSREEPLQWQFLTEQNLSQLRLNPDLLLLLTEPYILRSEAEHGGWNGKPFKDAPEPVKRVGNLEIHLIRTRRTQKYTQKLGTVDEIVPSMPYDSSGARPEIIPGSMLVATQKLADVIPFARSKVLIVKANQTTGFHGLVINRLILWDVITPLEKGLDPLKDAPLSYGGFLMTRKRPLVALTRHSVGDEHPEVLPGIYYLDQLATVNLRKSLKSHNRPVTDYWFFFGYSAWSWSQLFDEIADGSWNIINGTEQQLDWPMR